MGFAIEIYLLTMIFTRKPVPTFGIMVQRLLIGMRGRECKRSGKGQELNGKAGSGALPASGPCRSGRKGRYTRLGLVAAPFGRPLFLDVGWRLSRPI
jgi:hypothetical protein